MKHIGVTFVAAALAACVSSAVLAQSAADKTFLAKAIQGDNSEIMLGKLAQSKGDKSKDFGGMLVSDHTDHLSKAKGLADSMKMTAPDSATAAAKREETKLNKLSGARFDKEFATYMAKDHRMDIADYRKEAKHKGPVADMAKETLPTLQKHLEAAEDLRKG